MVKTKKKLVLGYTLPIKKCPNCGGDMSPIAWLNQKVHYYWLLSGFYCKECGESEYDTSHRWPFFTRTARVRSFELLGFEVRRN